MPSSLSGWHIDCWHFMQDSSPLYWKVIYFDSEQIAFFEIARLPWKSDTIECTIHKPAAYRNLIDSILCVDLNVMAYNFSFPDCVDLSRLIHNKIYQTLHVISVCVKPGRVTWIYFVLGPSFFWNYSSVCMASLFCIWK